MSKKSLRLSPNDPNSYAMPEIAKVVDIFLNLDADFDRHVLSGYVILTVEKVDPMASSLLLDNRNLSIYQVFDEVSGEKLNFNISEPEYVGSKIEIELPPTPDRILKIRIDYETERDCAALQWLKPQQTAGKTHPYLFSQCQAIQCRSMVPCQDTPSVKATYSAEITAPEELTVLMSAVRQGDPEMKCDGKRLHRFYQKIPVQSYLIAIAAGLLESRRIGPRSLVWSEKEIVDKAAFEFSETETMLTKAEELCGPYVWGVYDILVLPPSFPYGGMENPCLTFATPTLLAGDKSLANVIAHEIAHSWSGNLVTNKNFEHFWLNEGFTVFTERKIRGRIVNESERHFQAIGGWKELRYTIVDVLKVDNPLTSLVVDLNGVDPEDAFSTVPYEKGSTLLWYLEDIVGGPDVFEPFLKTYYDHFKYQSIDSYQFKDYFNYYFKDQSQNIDKIDWEAWFRQPGMPLYKPNFDQSLAEACTALAKKWISWNESEPCPCDPSEFKKLSSGQKIEFLSQLLEAPPLSIAKLEKMQELLDLNSYKNSEIRFRWIRLGLRSKWHDAVPRAIAMVTEQGRMKFLRPIYREMYAWNEVRDVAIDTFNRNKGSMMKVAIQGLESDLHLNKTS